MKREIKFRAYSNESGKMMNWDFIKSVNNLTKLLTLDHVYVMQFSGLLDNNSKEIYEGDIVEILNTNQYGKIMSGLYIIEFVDGCYRAILQGDKYSEVYPKCITNNISVEVVGNVYENPDLLRSKKTELK